MRGAAQLNGEDWPLILALPLLTTPVMKSEKDMMLLCRWRGRKTVIAIIEVKSATADTKMLAERVRFSSSAQSVGLSGVA